MNGRSSPPHLSTTSQPPSKSHLGHFLSFLWFSFSVTPIGISSNYLVSFPLNPCCGNKRYTAFDNESHRSASCLFYLLKHLYKAQQSLMWGSIQHLVSGAGKPTNWQECLYLHLLNINDFKICSIFQALTVPFQLCSSTLLLCCDNTPSNSTKNWSSPPSSLSSQSHSKIHFCL